MDALGADLRAFRDGFPVLARRGSTAYRIRKYVRRNWKPLAGSALALCLLFAGLMTLTRLDSARRSESQRADAVGGVLLEAIRSADPSNTLGVRVTAADILANAERLLSAQSSVPASTRSGFLVSIASTYAQLGEARRALSILDRAIVPGIEPTAEHQFAKARAKRSLEALDEAREILNKIAATDSTTAANVAIELAQVDYSAGKYQQMSSRLKKLSNNIHQHDTKLQHDIRYWQAVATSASHDFAAAAQLLNSLATDQKHRGEDPLRLARTLQRLSTEYIRADDHAKARSALTEAMRLISQVFGKDSFQYRTLESNLAFVLIAQGDIPGALRRVDSALGAMEEWLGTNHRRTAMMTFDAAMLHEESPDGPARALTLYGQAIDRSAVAFDTNHPNRFLFHITYAFFALESGDIETTLKLCEAADAIARNTETVREWDLFPALQALHSAARWRGAASPEAERDVRRRFATLASLLAENKLGPQTLDKVRALQTDLEKLGMRFVAAEKL